MRKKDREITDLQEILTVMQNCDACRLALNDTDGYPYLLPLNFGLEVKDNKVRLIFHSASEGHKLDLIRSDDRAAFEMDCSHKLQYFRDKGYCTMAYESVIGRGRIHILSDEEKMAAMTQLMAHYHPDQDAPFSTAVMERTTVYVLDVEELTGKRKLPK